jgi:hypothetical protein
MHPYGPLELRETLLPCPALGGAVLVRELTRADHMAAMAFAGTGRYDPATTAEILDPWREAAAIVAFALVDPASGAPYPDRRGNMVTGEILIDPATRARLFTPAQVAALPARLAGAVAALAGAILDFSEAGLVHLERAIDAMAPRDEPDPFDNGNMQSRVHAAALKKLHAPLSELSDREHLLRSTGPFAWHSFCLETLHALPDAVGAVLPCRVWTRIQAYRVLEAAYSELAQWHAKSAAKPPPARA